MTTCYPARVPTVRLEPQVYDALKKLAEPFVDTPSSVIRRLLEEKGVLPRQLEAVVDAAIEAHDDLVPTPQAVYEHLLLQILDEQFRGRGDKRSVTLAIVEKMQKQKLLRAADLELVATGETRAENAIGWSRNALKERGLLTRNSPRGMWELTQQGRAAARRSSAKSS